MRILIATPTDQIGYSRFEISDLVWKILGRVLFASHLRQLIYDHEKLVEVVTWLFLRRQKDIQVLLY